MKKTILITGTSSGIGEVASLYFAKQGWNVIAAVSAYSGAEAFVEHRSIMICRTDITDTASIENTVIDGIDEFGGIDVVLNNECHEENASGETLTRNVMRAILPHFRIKNRGTIVDVNPLAGSITTSVYEPTTESMMRKQCFTDAALIDFRHGIPDYFDFLFD